MMLFKSLATITDGIMKGLDELFTSDEERMKARLLLERQLQQPHLLQAMTNLEEAKHSSVFVAGWRPFIGWVCAIGLSIIFIVLPLLEALSATFGFVYVSPEFDTGVLMTLILSLLGLGGMRTFEKVKGVAREKDPSSKGDGYKWQE